MMNDITVQEAHWATDQQQLIAVRTQVFVEEQLVPAELEIDGLDVDCLHVKAVDSTGIVIATARLLPSHYIGRMCVLKSYRNKGIGRTIMTFFINHARRHQFDSLMLNAQLTALPFYLKFGFTCDSEVFIEADIEHVHMTLSLAD